MEKVEDKVTFTNNQINSDKFGPGFNYFKLAGYCLGNPSASGRTVAEIRNRVKLMDKLEPFLENSEPVGSVILSSGEVNTILTSFKEVRWTVVDKTIPEFEDYLNSLI